MRTDLKPSLALIALAAVVAFAVGQAVALPIVVTDESPRRLPYSGHLEEDGLAVDGIRTMQFEIVDVADNTLWTSADKAVAVRAGTFTAVLGDADDPPIPDAAFGPSDLYVRVSVEGTELGGRQRLHSAPFAIRATSAFEASEGGALQSQIASLQSQIDQLVAGVGTGVSINNSATAAGTVLDPGNFRAIFSNGAGDYRYRGLTSCTNGRFLTIGDLNSVITIQHDACGGTPGCFPFLTRTGATVGSFGGSSYNFMCTDGKWFEM